VVVYTPPGLGQSGNIWTRHVIDETLKWGHAVWTADLDGDGTDELIVGQRDPGTGPIAGQAYLSNRATDESATKWEKIVVDDGGVATEDLVAGDLNGDGRIDIVAGGRATHNVRVYENLGTASGDVQK